MKNIELELSFKGDRNYLHGTDFYRAIENSVEKFNDGWLQKISFKKLCRNQCTITFKKPVPSEQIIGSGIWQSQDNTSLKFWIIETSYPVENRTCFTEENIFKDSTINNKKIQINKENKYSVIENIVALTKKLNNQLSPDIEGKWLFGQIDLLNKLPDRYSYIEIVRNSERKNSFSRNKIIIDNTIYGELRFIVGKP